MSARDLSLEGQLPCGTALDGLLEQVADRRASADPDHQQQCPHCRAALAELRTLWEPVHALAVQPLPAPPGLLAQVMDQVHLLVRDGWHAVLADHRGVTRIAVWTIARIACRAAALPGVVFVVGTARPGPSGGVGAAGRSVVVHLDAIATYGEDLVTLGRRIRVSVSAQVQALTGCTVVEVNVRFVDVQAPVTT
jgi:cell envelope-related Asp23 family protein